MVFGRACCEFEVLSGYNEIVREARSGQFLALITMAHGLTHTIKICKD